MSFSPRLRFPFPGRTPSWFAGHMARSLNQLPTLLKDIDLVIEARDARLPLTSVNAAFDDVLKQSWGLDGRASGANQRGKVVVYTKRDLAESRYEQVSLRRFFSIVELTLG
jgi:ribosome biogenesis GTPase A